MNPRPQVGRSPSRIGGLLLLAGTALLVMAIMRFFKAPANTMIWDAAMDAGHVVLFGVFALVSLRFTRLVVGESWRHPLIPFGLALGITVAFSFMTELLQFFSPRDADLTDFLRNLCGAVGALSLVGVFELNGRRRKLISLVLAMGFLGAGFLSFFSLAAAQVQRARAFPTICNFESRWEEWYYGVRHADLVISASPEVAAGEGSRAGHLTFLPSDYPGFHIREVHPDWRGYTALRFTVHSELTSSVDLVLRLDDTRHNGQFEDRFNKVIPINPGRNDLLVPLETVRDGPSTREMDLGHMRNLVLFAVKPAESFSLYIDSFRLE